MDKPFETRITELFGIRLPIIAGGLQWLANGEYVAAAANAGIMGFITAASFPELDDLRAEIRRCRDGAEYRLVIRTAATRRELLRPLPGSATLGAEVVYAVRDEMALRLDDVFPIHRGDQRERGGGGDRDEEDKRHEDETRVSSHGDASRR